MLKIKTILIALAALSIFAAPATSVRVSAAPADNKTTSTTNTAPKCGNPPKNASYTEQLKQNCIVQEVINPIIKVFGAIVGIVIVGTIIFGGIQYSIAGDKAEDVAKAKQRITNGMIALAAFLFAYAFLKWLVPGGIFSN